LSVELVAAAGSTVRDEITRLGSQTLMLPGDIADLARAMRRMSSRWHSAHRHPSTSIDIHRHPSTSIDIHRHLDQHDNGLAVFAIQLCTAMTVEECVRMLSIIRLGMVIGSGAALKRTLLYAHGTIVQVGSAPACRGQLQSVYRRAKHVIQGFRASMRCEPLHENNLAQHGPAVCHQYALDLLSEESPAHCSLHAQRQEIAGLATAYLHHTGHPQARPLRPMRSADTVARGVVAISAWLA
jgi:NAD(P)-dependent dehydrogenase (short-subunit alcohol dehydrogenase family)